MKPSHRTFFGWIGIILVAIALIALLFTAGRALVLLFQQSISAISFPYQLNYGEGPLLDQTVRLTHGISLYRLDVPPYTIENYPPVFMLAQAPWVSAFGPSYYYGRITSLISILVSALFLGLTAHTITRSRVAALVSAVLLPAFPYVFHWSALARIDSLALAFSLVGLWIAVRWPKSTWAAFWAALMLGLAVYTRQTYLLAAPLAAFTYRWAVGGATPAFKFAVMLGGLVVGLFAVLLVATEGGFWFHLVTANVNALDGSLISIYADEVARALTVLLVMALIYLLGGWINARSRRAWWLVAPYLLGGLAVALTIAKIGSDVNYLYELCAALCLTAGAFIAWCGRLSAVRAAAIVIIAVQVAAMQDISEQKYAPIISERIDRRPEMDSLLQLVNDETRTIIADEAMGLLPLVGKPILFQPFEMSQLAAAGLWDETDFLTQLAQGSYPVVLIYNPYRNPNLRFERWTPAMLSVINSSHRLATQRAETSVYWYNDPR
ncbi:MAG: glycosyltransferase family 39 protein [Anaerolineae bacterium]|nr:glycosyltransferase family 39 protein [Anaerolineae bacterium]